MNALNKKTNTLSEQIVFAFLASFCIGAIGSIVLYVLVHGSEKGIWDLRYFTDLLIAVFLVLFIGHHFRNNRFPGFLITIEHLSPSLVACILIVASFLIQFFIVSSISITPDGDYAVFQSVALDISKHEKVRLAEYVALFPHILGYSTFIGSLYHLFGRSDMAPIINVILCSFSTLFLYTLVYNHSHCIVASTVVSVLWMVCPSMLLFNIMVLSEPLYTTEILFFFLIISIADRELTYQSENKTYLQKRSANLNTTAGLMGMLCGLVLQGIQLVRPLSYIILIALLIFAIHYRHIIFQSRTIFRCCVVFFCLFLISFYLSGILWDKHSSVILEEIPARFPGYNLLTGFNPETSGTHSETDYQLLLAARAEQGATASSAQHAMLDYLVQRLKSGTGYLPRHLFEKYKVFAGSDDYAVFYAASVLSELFKKILEHISNVYYYALLILVIFSCFQLIKSRFVNHIAFLVSLFILGLSSAHVLFLEVNGRYHYSLIPLFLYLIGVMLSDKQLNTNP